MGLLQRVLTLGTACALFVDAAQLPLRPGQQVRQNHTRGAWDSIPNTNATGHLIFDTVGSLLKHWSNTWYRNGHIVVPAVITPGTLVYHGRSIAEPPPGPEWLSLDPEHSLLFSNQGLEGHLFTYVATRELRLLYFDGNSAATMSGAYDTQDLVALGYVRDRSGSPFVRILELCEWGKQYDLDGFLRMEFDFEVMYCNFTDGLELVSDLASIPFGVESPASDLTDFFPGRLAESRGRTPPPYPTGLPPPRRPGPPGRVPKAPSPPPGWQGSLRAPANFVFESLHAGILHNFSPLTGIRVDYSRLLSLYDTKYESLVESRASVASRFEHHLINISKADAQTFQKELHNVLTRSPNERGSGIDWGQMIRHVTERYAGRLDFLGYLLQSVDVESKDEARTSLNKSEAVHDFRLQVLTMLSPYLARDSVPSSTNDSTNTTWLASAMEHCSSTYTSHLRTSSFTPQEHIYKSAIEETAGQICRTLGTIWTTAFSAESITSSSEQLALLRRWKVEVQRLKDWLGWAQWVKCDPACAEDEVCSIPQWPFDGVFRGDEDTTPHCLSKLHWQWSRRWPGGGRPGRGDRP